MTEAQHSKPQFRYRPSTRGARVPQTVLLPGASDKTRPCSQRIEFRTTFIIMARCITAAPRSAASASGALQGTGDNCPGQGHPFATSIHFLCVSTCCYPTGATRLIPSPSRAVSSCPTHRTHDHSSLTGMQLIPYMTVI